MNLILANYILLIIAFVLLLSELLVTRKEDKSISGIVFQIMLLIAICCCVLLIYDGTVNQKLLYFKSVIARTSLPCLALALLIRESYWRKRVFRSEISFKHRLDLFEYVYRNSHAAKCKRKNHFLGH